MIFACAFQKAKFKNMKNNGRTIKLVSLLNSFRLILYTYIQYIYIQHIHKNC